MAIKFGHEGELSAGHRNTTQSMSFGLESGRLRKASASYSYDIFDANGKLSWNGERNGFYTKGDLSIGHVEGAVEYDNTSFLPKVSARGEANLARFKGEMGSSRDKVEHKIADVNFNAFGGSVSAQAGGNTVLPAASAEAHTVGGGASVGFDDFRIKGGLGNGPSSSASIDAKNMIPDGALDKLNTDTPGFFGDAYGAVKDPGAAAGAINSPFKASSSEGNLGQSSVSIPGAVSINGNGNGGVEVKPDAGPDSYSTAKNFGEAITGRSGNEKGTPFETNAGAHRRRALTDDAEKFHKDNAKKLDGHHFPTSKTKNNIADDGCGYVNRLNSAIDQAKAQKQAVDAKMRSEGPGSKDYPKWSKQSDELGSEIDKMTGIRDNISDLRDRANNLQGRLQPADTAAGRKTEDITRDARANADRFENAFTGKDSGYSGKTGMGEHLAGPAADVCRSRNELNGRINQLDRRLAQNNADIAGNTKARQDYLNQNGMDLKSALDAKDPKVAEFNRREEGLRKENQGLRGEKAECQKALMETDKNFMPRYGSEPYEKKDRDLKSQKLDNENEKAKADDDIANYCNSHGITKDSAGNYVTPDGQKDPVLDELQDKKKGLDAEGKDIDKLTAENKQDLAKSGLDGKSELKVSEKDGNAVVSYSRDDYGKHAVDNEDMRGPKDTSEPDKSKEGSDTNRSDSSAPGGGDTSSEGEKDAAGGEKNSDKENKPSENEKGAEENENTAEEEKSSDGKDGEDSSAEGEKNSGEENKPSENEKGGEKNENGPGGGDNSSDGSDGSDSGNDDNSDDDGLKNDESRTDNEGPSENEGHGDDNAPGADNAADGYQKGNETEENPDEVKPDEEKPDEEKPDAEDKTEGESDKMDEPDEEERSDGEDKSGSEENSDITSESESPAQTEGSSEGMPDSMPESMQGATEDNSLAEGTSAGVSDTSENESPAQTEGSSEGMPDSMPESMQGATEDNSPAEGTSAGVSDTTENESSGQSEGSSEGMPDTMQDAVVAGSQPDPAIENPSLSESASESSGPSVGSSAPESESSAQMPDTSESAGASEGSSAPEKEASAGMPDASESAGPSVSGGASESAAPSVGGESESSGTSQGSGMGI